MVNKILGTTVETLNRCFPFVAIVTMTWYATNLEAGELQKKTEVPKITSQPCPSHLEARRAKDGACSQSTRGFSFRGMLAAVSNRRGWWSKH